MRLRTPVSAAALAAMSAFALAACVPNSTDDAEAIAVSATDTECKVATDSAPAGVVTFTVTNDGKDVTEFEIVADDKLRIISEVENLGPGITRDLVVRVPEGSYYATCKPGMVGDGVNDILPIKRADFGVAMGAGSPATKAVAGVVLETDDFAALPAVLAEGRRVVGNVRRAAKLFLLKNVYTVALVLVAVGVCGLPFPYLPQQPGCNKRLRAARGPMRHMVCTLHYNDDAGQPVCAR